MNKQNRDAISIDRNNFNILNTKKIPILKSKSNQIITKSENTASEISDYKKPKTPKDLNAVINISNKQPTSSTHNQNYKELEKEKEKKFFKFQNMSKLIVNKIDDILGSYSNPGYASSSISNYSDTLGLSKNILNNIETNLQIAEENDLRTKFANKNYKSSSIPTDSYSNTSANSISRKKLSSEGNLKKKSNENNNSNKDFNNVSNNNQENKAKKYLENTEKQAKEIDNIINEIQKEKTPHKSNASDKAKKGISKAKKKIEGKSKIQKDVFMTKVEIEGEIKSSSEEEEKERKIPFDEADLYDSSDEDVKVNPELRKEMNDFRNMINEIDELKNGMKNEFDELQFLIKYVDGTSTRVNRHMNGISNLFQQSGLKPKSDNALHRLSEEDEESDDEYGKNKNNLYNKNKNMDRIKDNLINLQDNFIGYYKNFDGGMKSIETNVAKCKQMLLYEKKKDEKINL